MDCSSSLNNICPHNFVPYLNLILSELSRWLVPFRTTASKIYISNTQISIFSKTKKKVLLYLSVPAMGVAPVDGVTAVNPEGLTAATGIHAQTFADRLAALNLKCNVITPAQYRPAMFEKLM